MTYDLKRLAKFAGFQEIVPPFGYRWWYFDAFSDDYRYGITIIAFIGSVFSPYYAFSRECDRGNPYNHCAINVSLYGKGGKRWSMTERSHQSVTQSSQSFSVGPSSLELSEKNLTINISEWTFPIPGRLNGKVEITPKTLIGDPVTLDDQGPHFWQPIAPICEVDVNFDTPHRQWKGRGYFDTNWGSQPLESGFKSWDWSRADLPNGRSAILYDVVRKNNERFSLARVIDKEGNIDAFNAPVSRTLKKSLWRVERHTQSDPAYRPKVISTLEDAPFYARSMIKTSILGSPVTAMHESLNLDRFASKWVQALLPFKMPRQIR